MLTAQRCVCGMCGRTRSKEPCDAQVHGMMVHSACVLVSLQCSVRAGVVS